jgi:peroxiredoxin Q/BCP
MGKIKVGDTAPDFKARDQNGKAISLSQFRGKKVILYFYPKDDTPGCTAEACSLRDSYAVLTKKGFVVIGISADNAASHLKFQKKHELPFILIPDEEKKIIQSYGAWGEKSMYGKSYEGIIRTTYVIDEKGMILLLIDKVNTKDHANQILEELNK